MVAGGSISLGGGFSCAAFKLNHFGLAGKLQSQDRRIARPRGRSKNHRVCNMTQETPGRRWVRSQAKMQLSARLRRWGGTSGLEYRITGDSLIFAAAHDVLNLFETGSDQ